jgi:hypothetical protein
MNIPKKIKIGALTFKVVIEDLGEDKLGETDRTCSTIRINSIITKQEQVLTFFHEVFHQVNATYDEERVEFLATSVYQLLQDNHLLR